MIKRNINILQICFFISLLGLLNLQANDKKAVLKATEFSIIEQNIGKGKAMMLEFGAETCHSCVVMGELLYEIKQNNPDSAIYFINLYKDKEAARKYRIRMMPSQVFLNKEGQIIAKHVGMIRKDDLEKKLKEFGIIND